MAELVSRLKAKNEALAKKTFRPKLEQVEMAWKEFLLFFGIQQILLFYFKIVSLCPSEPPTAS